VVLTLIAGLVLVGLAGGLFARAAAMPRLRIAAQLGQIDAYGFGDGDGAAAGASTPGPLDTLADRIGAALVRRTRIDEAKLRQELLAAGVYRLAPARFVGYRALGSLATTTLFAWAATSYGYGPVLAVLAGVLGAAFGWLGSITVVRRRARLRLERIDLALPDLIDLLVVMVEAGLGFNGALHIAVARTSGPLADELRLTLQEQNMGLATHEALEHMQHRANTPAMRSFVRSVLQGESLGVSIGQIMRNIAIDMRKRRRQAAEERAQKAPIKLLFPLVFLIFPAMFIVLLAPAAIEFTQSFGGR